jgi:hypothetical protein
MSKKITYKLCVKSLPDGLLYLCYTAKEGKEFDSYKGSGKYWKRHIKAHNYNINDISTTVIFETDSMEELSEKGEFYSDVFGVETRERWANLAKETGQGTALCLEKNPNYGGKYALKGEMAYMFGSKNPKVSESNKKRVGNLNPNYGKFSGDKNPMFGKIGKQNPVSKAVNQIDLESGNILGFYESVRQAEINTRVANQDIIKVCKGQRKTAGGYKWEYATNEQVNSIV